MKQWFYRFRVFLVLTAFGLSVFPVSFFHDHRHELEICEKPVEDHSAEELCHISRFHVHEAESHGCDHTSHFDAEDHSCELCDLLIPEKPAVYASELGPIISWCVGFSQPHFASCELTSLPVSNISGRAPPVS